MTQPIQSVYVASGQIEANIIKGLLEAAGIPAEISQEGAGEVYGITVGLLGEVHVLVAADRAAEAEALLRTMDQETATEPEVPEDAPPAEEVNAWGLGQEKAPEAGRHSDPKGDGSIGYTNNQTEDKTRPAFALPDNKPAPPGVWTLEFSRKRVTGSEFDVQFADLTATYYFGLAVFDNAQVRHAFEKEALPFVFKP